MLADNPAAASRFVHDGKAVRTDSLAFLLHLSTDGITAFGLNGTPNRRLRPHGNRRAYIRNGALGTITAIRHGGQPEHDTVTVAFDDIGTVTIPRSFFDRHRTRSGRIEAGIDHAYALTSCAVQGATNPESTSRIDPTANRSEAYVDITRGRHANHLYVTRATDRLDGEHLPALPPPPVDRAVAHRLAASTGEITAWDLANPPGDAQAISARSLGG